MSDRTITQNIFALGDGDHAVFETSSQDTITIVGESTCRRRASAAKAS